MHQASSTSSIGPTLHPDVTRFDLGLDGVSQVKLSLMRSHVGLAKLFQCTVGYSVSKPATAGRVMGALCCCVMCDSREHWESSVWSHVNSHIGDFKFIPLSPTPKDSSLITPRIQLTKQKMSVHFWMILSLIFYGLLGENFA